MTDGTNIEKTETNTESNTEVEKKYLVIDLPDGLLEPRPFRTIRQGYLSLEPDKEILIRDLSGTFSMTITKRENSKTSTTEVPLKKKQFDALWPMTVGTRLEKKRYHVGFTQHDIDIDVFDGELKPLVLVEVEFDDEQELAYFVAPDFAAADVTCDEAYDTANLASHGLPDNFLRRLAHSG